MEFSTNRISTFVIVIALASLTALATAQFFVLEETMAANRLLFEQKLGLIKQTITKEFRNNRALAIELEQALQDPYHVEENIRSFNRGFRKLTDSVFDSYAVPISYQYGIYAHGHDEASFDKKWSDIEDPGFTFDACQNYAQANLTCGNGYASGYHLALFFPNEKMFLIEQSSKSIRFSLIFIGLVLLCFIYAMITIRRQKKLSELKNDFIDNLTHEFKTPVFSIGVALKTIREIEDFKKSEKLQRYLAVIENENERLKNQTDKILQLAMVQSGNFLLERKSFHLHEALQRIANNFKLTFEERGAQVDFDLSCSHPVIQADETHLSNVFYNLLDNALKYTEGAPRIGISTFDSAHKSIAVCISDNGVGIGKEAKQFIFNKFYHRQARPGINGFGLGLHYARTVVEAHAGKIIVKSELEKGSAFYIYLPCS
jgi:two-component system, OmpR family, phosphate regulon sensor histidine kinase PhoR